MSKTVDDSVELTTLFANELAAGIVVVGGADSTKILIKRNGIVMANKFAATFAAGDSILCSSSSGLVFREAVPITAGIFGRALEAATLGAVQVKILMFGVNVKSA